MVSGGLYVHVPFCDGKCSYCAFYSVTYSPELADAYLRCVEREIGALRGLYPRLRIDTIYFGGGTPSLLSDPQMRRLCSVLAAHGLLDHAREWTVEANPGTLDRRKLDTIRQAGVNRISLGAQSFDDSVLRRLGRRHSALHVYRAAETIRAAGFENLGLDLLACVPGVDLSMWRRTLTEATALRPRHISVYALTVEEGTALAGAAAGNTFHPPDDEDQLRALHAAQRLLAKASFRRYEISNYAHPGFECLHNLSCWRGDDYLGVGPGASSRVGLRRWTNLPDLGAYLAALERARPPPRAEEELSPELAATEMLIFGLRMAEGVDLDLIARRTGVSTDKQNKWIALLSELSDSSLLLRRNTRWQLSSRGRDLADYVAVELMD